MDELARSIDYFTGQTHILDCMSIVCGNGDSHLFSSDGEPDRIFDLASITKLFTGILCYRLMEEGLLDFSKQVTAYAPQFSGLCDVSVSMILGFETGLVTPQRVDAQPDREAALAVLWQIKPRDNGYGRAYSDMHAMVLKHVLEGASGMRYMELLRSRILMPLGMAHTWCTVPEAQRELCVSYDREHRIEKEHYILREGITPGVPHDPKARILMREDDCPGHAGLFATIDDIRRLAQGLLQLKLLSRSSLRDMARNRTGRPSPEGGWTQFLGAQCYVKHPEQYYSEVPEYMGEQAIALSGFTGHHLSVDPQRGIFACYLGNRVRNRLSVLLPPEGKRLTDYGLNPDGTGSILWPDGERIWSSVEYVHHKDRHFHQNVREALGL